MRWLYLAAILAVAFAKTVPRSSDPCDDVDCRAGRECITSGGVAQCLCVTSCPDHDRPVCGNDGLSYDNYCLLHQRACLTGEHISVDYKGYCKADIAEAMREFGLFVSTTKKPVSTSTTTSKPPLQTERQLSVCYGPQRDALRDMVISVWQKNVPQQPWYTENMTYRESLSGHFFACDKDRDYLLRPDELLDCFEKVPFTPRKEQDAIVTKTLCIDAMVEETDSNKDWKLNFQEFSRLLDPLYELVAKNCSLEGKDYTDGAEVKVDCNHCVCATGSWVCATHECDTQTKSSGVSQVKSTKKKDEFGYMDSKYDLIDSKAKKIDDYDYGDYDDDDYFDDDEDDYSDEDDDYSDEDDKSLEDYKKEEAEKEFNSLSEVDKKTVANLEDSIKKFKISSGSVSNSLDSEESEESLEDEEADLIAEEDDIVEQYDALLQKSRAIRTRLNRLRNSLSSLEERKQRRERVHYHSSGGLNDVRLNDIDGDRTRSRKQKKYEAYRQSLLNNMNHNRRLSQVENDIWEDQWKSKISKHHHQQDMSNHL